MGYMVTNVVNKTIIIIMTILIISVIPISSAVQNLIIDTNDQKENSITTDDSEKYFLKMKDGFKYLHLEGTPQQIGYLHGNASRCSY